MSIFTTWFDMQHSSPAYNIARANGHNYKLYGHQVEKALADPTYPLDSSAKAFGLTYESTSRFRDPPKSNADIEAMRRALGITESDPTLPTSSGDGSGSGYGGSSPVTYSDWSPAAKLFGMDQSTAYEEHLANTAHQREVADLKAAGLNPVLGISSGAASVSGSVPGSGSGYAASAKKLPIQGIADVIGSVAGLIITASSKNRLKGAAVASATAKAASEAGSLLDKIFND